MKKNNELSAVQNDAKETAMMLSAVYIILRAGYGAVCVSDYARNLAPGAAKEMMRFFTGVFRALEAAGDSYRAIFAPAEKVVEETSEDAGDDR